MPLTVSVIMPALNEAKNVGAAIADTLQAMDDYAIEGEIIVVNDGSTDETEARVRDAMDADPRVRLTNHPAPKGIGASFWEGVAAMRGDIVTMLPATTRTSRTRYSATSTCCSTWTSSSRSSSTEIGRAHV